MMNPNIDSNFEKWRSSLLDYLIGYCKLDGLVNQITKNPEDVLSVSELKEKYKSDFGTRGLSDRDFISITKALLD